MSPGYWSIVSFCINSTSVLTVSVCLARGADENLAGASEDHAGAGGGNGHLTAAAAVSHPFTEYSLIEIQIIKSFPECIPDICHFFYTGKIFGE